MHLKYKYKFLHQLVLLVLDTKVELLHIRVDLVDGFFQKFLLLDRYNQFFPKKIYLNVHTYQLIHYEFDYQ